MHKLTRFVASLLPFSVFVSTLASACCGVVLLGDGNAAELEARQQARARLTSWREHWMQVAREEPPAGLRFVRDPVFGCEYVVVPEGITPRMKDGAPYCPAHIEQPEGAA